jgi:hypothetical protein
MAGSEGIWQTHSTTIVLAEVLKVAWMIWLVVVAWRMQCSEPSRVADEGLGRPAAIYLSRGQGHLANDSCGCTFSRNPHRRS